MISKIKQFFKQKHSQKAWQLLINQDRRNFLLVFGLFIIIASAFFAVYKINNKAQAGWWNDTWQYRKKIAVGSGSSAVSDYQIKINDYNTSTDISANKMQTNCGDIRFTSEQGVELPYWIESGCNSSTTDIWVKVDNIPATGGTDIYMYYGNPSATNGSNGTDTFIFFDDYSTDTSTNYSVVSAGTIAYDATNQVLKQTDTTGAQHWIVSNFQNIPSSYIYEAKVKVYNDVTGHNHAGLTTDFLSTAATGYRLTHLNSIYVVSKWTSGTETAINSFADGGIYSDNTWILNRVYRDRNSGLLKYEATNGTSTVSGSYTDTDHTTGSIGFHSYGSESWYDDVRVRKYLATEPTVGSPGSEEQTVSPIAYYSFDESLGTTIHNQQEKNGENGLVSWWKFDDASSSTSPAPQDTMGINNGAWNGNASYTTTSKIGNAATFDGTGDYVQVTDNGSLDITSQLTLSTWARFTSAGTIETIMSKWGSPNHSYILWKNASNQLNFNISGDGSSTVTISGSTTLSVNTWYHLAAVYDGSSIKIYVNGVLDGANSTSIPTSIFSGSANLLIGRNPSDTSQDWPGQLDSVQIFNRALSNSEIVADYSSVHGHMMYMDPTTDWVEGARQNSQQRTLGKALDFDGTDDVLMFQDTHLFDMGYDDMSVSFWLKTTDDTGYIVWKGNTTSYYMITVSSGKISVKIYFSPNAGPITYSTTSVNNGLWNHVVVSWDRNGDQKIYINGKFENSDSISARSGDNIGVPSPFTVGSSCDTTGYCAAHLNGQIDELKIYKQVLSSDQIKAQYNRGAGAVMGAVIHAGAGAAPKGYWKLDEGSGFSAFDTSGNNNTGILTNMDATTDWVAGKVGKALDFDGSDDYITIADNSSIGVTSALTVSSWINPDVIIGDDATTRWLEKGDNYFLLESTIDCSDGNSTNPGITFLVKQANTNKCVKTTQQIPVGEWHHVTGTYDGANLKIYIDGILLNTKALTGSIDDDNLPLIIGSDDSFTTYYFNGKIDHVKVYDYARTPEQIHYDMATGSPVAYYSFDEGAGTTVHNSQEKNGENGLVSWWKFDTASSGTITTAYDEKSVNNGTGSNAIYSTTAKIGNAGYFDGTGDYITVTDNDSLDLTQISISAWVRIGTATNFATILGKRDSGSATANYGFRTGTTGSIDELEFYWINSSNWQIYTTTNANLATGTWYYLTATYDGSSVKIYKDGVLLTGSCTSGTCNNALQTTNDNFGIGWSGEMGAEYWNGYLDSVKLYNRVLSAAEIIADYNSVHGHMMYMDSSTDWVEGAKQNLQQRALGKALDFDGSNDRVQVPYNSNLNFSGRAAFTISAWINPKVNNAYGSIVSQSDGTTNTYVMAMNASGKIEAGRIVAATGNTVIPTNKWTHVVFTYDGTYINVYVNAMVDATPTSDINNAGSSDDLLIGAWNYTSPSVFFNGSIDEVKIYNYALAANEVKTEYNRGAAVVLGAGKSESDTAESSLVGWWKMDEASGYTAFDASGKNNTGVLTNMDTTSDWVTGKVGKALDFDGSDDYVSVTDPGTSTLDISGALTASAWVKWNSLKDFGVILNKGTGSTAANFNYSIWSYASGKVSGYIGNGSTGNTVQSNTTFVTNRWYYITFTADGSNLKLYIDGILDNTATQTITPATNNNNFTISQTSYILDGQIDHVKIWSKALSSGEIAWEYNQGSPIYHWDFNDGQGILATNAQGKSVTADGLVGFWTMDNTGTVVDLSGNGNNLSNATSSATLGTGIKAGALSFPTTNKSQYGCTDANCGADLDYQGNGFTISTWVKATDFNQATWRNIVIKHYYNSSTDNGGYTISTYTDGRPYFLVRNSNGTNETCDAYALSGSIVSTTAWMHIVGVYDNNSCKIYINGVLHETEANPVGIKNVSEDFTIGGNAGGNYMFNGLIDHTKVWQRALTATEVAIEYGYDEKYGYLTNMDAASDWVNGALPATNRPMLGKALDFDGSDDYISTSYDPISVVAGSISAWIKSSGNPDNYDDGIIGNRINTSSNWEIQLTLHANDNVEMQINGVTGLSSTTLFNDNKWHHIVITWQENGASDIEKLYVDGKLEDEDSVSLPSEVTSYLRIGHYYDSNPRYFPGQLDEIKIYNYALSANQVKLDYNNSAAVRY